MKNMRTDDPNLGHLKAQPVRKAGRIFPQRTADQQQHSDEEDEEKDPSAGAVRTPAVNLE